MSFIIQPNEIEKRINEENLELWICSYGGCGTNLLADYLENIKQIRIHTKSWRDMLCHCHTYIPTKNCKAIYMYCRDPIDAFKSQIKRGLHVINLKKLVNTTDIEYSDIELLKAMSVQYKNWINEPNVLKICYDTLYEQIPEIESFLKIDMSDFPKKRERTSKYTILENEKELRLITKYLF
jgi:hypothetical protein